MARPPAEDKARAAPTCIFCDKPSGTVAYVWPEWLCRFLIERQGVAHRFGGSQRAILERMAWEVDTTVTQVCDACSQGWMQSLENKVSPFLKAMVVGEPTALSPLRRRLLARWAAKTAVVMECALDTPVRTPRFARECLREIGVHAGTQVLVGRYVGESQVLTHERDVFTRTVDGEQRFIPQATLVIGHLFVQVFADPSRSAAPELIESASNPLIPLVGSIGRHLMWPPEVSIDDTYYGLARYGVLAGGAAWSAGNGRDCEGAISLHN